MPEQVGPREPGWQKLAEIGPFGGLNATPDFMYVSPNDAIDCLNYDPRRRYGAFTLCKGRIHSYNFQSSSIYMLGIFISSYSSTTIIAATGSGLSTLKSNLGGAISLPAGVSGGVWKPYSCTQYGGFFFISDGTSFGSSNPLKLNKGLFPSASRWQITPPQTAPTFGVLAAGNLNGAYWYRYTYYNATTGQESSPSPISAQTNPSSQQVPVNWVASSDAQVTHVNLYRIGGTLAIWQQVTSTPIGTTTYTDNTADGSLAGAPLVLHRDPPAAFRSVTKHKERIWGFGYAVPYPYTFSANNTYVQTPAQGSDLWFSKYQEGWSFDSVNNVLPLGRDIIGGDDGIALASIGSVLVALKRYSTYIVVGDTEQDFRPIKAFDIGCMAASTVATGYGLVFWASSSGIWMYDGNSPVCISEGFDDRGGIKQIFDWAFSSGAGGIADFWWATVYERTYFISITDRNDFQNTRLLGYHIPTRRWFAVGFDTGTVPLMAITDADFPAMYASPPIYSSNTTVDQLFLQDGDAYGSLAGTWTSPPLDSGKPESRKTYRYAIVEVPASDPQNTIDLRFYVDGGLVKKVTFNPRPAGYPAQVLVDSPTFYVRCDEPNGTPLPNMVNLGSAPATVSTGLLSRASGLLVGDTDRGFLGIGNLVATSLSFLPTSPRNDAAFMPGTQLSVESLLWWGSAGPSGNKKIFTYGDANNPAWILKEDPSGGVFFGVNTVAGFKNVVSAPLATVTKYHVCGTYDGVTLSLYVNGVLTSSIVNSPLVNNAGNFGFGFSCATNSLANDPVTSARIDEVAVYPTALPVARILAHYQTAFQLKDAAQLASQGLTYYRVSFDNSAVGYKMVVKITATETNYIPPVVERITFFGSLKDDYAPITTNPAGSQ